MLWQFFSLPGIENGIEYRYFSRYRIEVRNSSIVTTLLGTRFNSVGKACIPVIVFLWTPSVRVHDVTNPHMGVLCV